MLRDHLIRGYSANERRLRELRRSLRLVENALEGEAVTSDEAAALLRVVTDYACGSWRETPCCAGKTAFGASPTMPWSR